MATIDALKSKNTLITAASVVGALVLDAVLGRRGKSTKLSNVSDRLPDGGDLVDDLRDGVSSVARKAKSAVPTGSGGGEQSDGGDEADERSGGDGGGSERGVDELAERRRERQERRDQRKKAI